MPDQPTYLTHPALESDRIAHGFFTRLGGGSTGIYAGLNIGIGSADDPMTVQRNRASAMVALGLPPDALNTLYQVHSADVVEVARPLDPENLPRADGMVSSVPGLALGIATADCAPVLFADAKSGIVGACHAGWKGALGGVVETTVLAMEKLGAERADIAAVLGPCIHQQSYEVGPEFREAFLDVTSDFDVFFLPSDRDRHYRFDLPGFVLGRLEASQVAEIGHVAEDTYSDPDRYYSYRRATHLEERSTDGTIDYGRLLSTIALRN
ncbi:MAG: peptidoglycan editing factor PgeF [Alphaproteobacteria bacterium]|nr:peptidoglycan editing factor PgeF [Alphaproteobacteria bacterium]